jgi:putative transposase
MREFVELFIHFLCTLAKLSRPGGVKVVMAETLATKQQLIVKSRGKMRAPKLKTSDRFIFGFLAFFIGEKRLRKVSVILKPATILKFHSALVKRKYSQLYSNKPKKLPGRKGPDQALIDLVIEMRNRNPLVGYGRISMQIYQEFGIEISRFAVGRILRKHYGKNDPGKGEGPSWLTFIGHMKDSLWSVDLFRCESISLRSHWVMVVLDQYTRRIIGFAVHTGDCDGIAYCCMFNQIISGKTLPKYLSSDNDPLFLFHRWKANLRIMEVNEIKSIPGNPVSHPFIERVIGSTRREYLDHILFFNAKDLQNKLDQFQNYYNETRAHSSIEMKTPNQMANEVKVSDKVISIDNYRWKSHCRGLYKLPVAA